MFISALKAAEVCCAVTGESINDADALSAASVGFSMGVSGCAVAKDHADIVLLDDNFASIFNACRWGRNIFDNIRKFIQFQVTVNLSCLLVVIIGGATLGKSPFSILQLLWINLVMDVLAAIALATEAPHPTQLRKERISRKDSIVTPLMWRAITSQLLYQGLVMLILLYFGPSMFGIKYNLVKTPLYATTLTGSSVATYRLQHYTLLF